jgi:hypothetical protein
MNPGSTIGASNIGGDRKTISKQKMVFTDKGTIKTS